MLIDLSVAINDRTPSYPGDPVTKIDQTTDFGSKGYVGHSITLGSHTGTHIDAPAHMIEGAPTLGSLPVELFTGQAKLIEGFSFEAVEAAGLEPGDIVFFDTATSERYYEESYFLDFPTMSTELADYLIAREVKLVGIDTCSADNDKAFPVHKKLLGAGIPIIENLTNLTELKGKTFSITAFPLKIDLDGAPARVIADVSGE